MRPPGLKKPQNNEANTEVLQTWTLMSNGQPGVEFFDYPRKKASYISVNYLSAHIACNLSGLFIGNSVGSITGFTS